MNRHGSETGVERRLAENGKQKRERSGSRRRKSHKRRRRIRILMISMFIIAAAGAAAAILATLRNNPDSIQAQFDILPDSNVVNGVLNAGEGESLDQGEYWIVLNQLPTMEAGSRKCNIQFENPAQNHYSSRINLYLKSTGKRLGGTRRVDPGQYVEYVELEQTLDPGEYPVVAKIELFAGKDPAGEMSLEITLRIVEG